MMMQPHAICYILIAIFALSYNEVQGRTKLSHLEDLELEKQLKLLNKPAIKTIKTDYGDIYDCVDFYKQPAFDHPLLQNHTFHPKMKPMLPMMDDGRDNAINSRLVEMGFKKGGCPDGTVPIRRTTKNDLIRQKLMPPIAEDAFFNNTFSYETNLSDKAIFPSKGYKLAIVQTENNPNNKFGGAGMPRAVIYNPRVEGQQNSACRMKIQKGSENIQVGWRVDPTLYGDNMTRLYTHFQAGKTQCFNTQCPGFVMVNTKIPLDFAFHEATQRGSHYVDYEVGMYIKRDLYSGNWWLLLAPLNTHVGFWPKTIFNELNDFASTVEWGGVVYSPPGVLEPPMGSSFMPIGDLDYDAFCHINTVDENGQEVVAGSTTVYMTNPDLYKVVDLPNYGPDHLHVIAYGGPGESKNI